jgi:site-specific DNA recombinase
MIVTEQQTHTNGRRPCLCAAIYCRGQAQATGRSDIVEHQLAVCREACRSQGWSIVGQYHDEATSTASRPELSRALADSAIGEFDVLIVSKLDRLSHTIKDVLTIVLELEQVGVRLVSVADGLDTRTPVGRVQIQVLGAFAEIERGMIRDRVREGIERRARNGYWIGPLPVGLRDDGSGKPVSDPAWLPLVERMYHLYVRERLDTASIARCLNAEGIRTPRGARWTRAGVVRILRCSAYVALIRWNGHLLPAAHDPVIDRELWDLAQAISTP